MGQDESLQEKGVISKNSLLYLVTQQVAVPPSLSNLGAMSKKKMLIQRNADATCAKKKKCILHQ